MLRLALLACLALLAVPTVAFAAAPTIADAQRIAAAAFPGPCGPALDITFVSTSDITGHDGRATGRWLIDGQWQTLDCSIEVRAGLSPERTCDVIVHERGHLAGIDEHTTGGVMSAEAGGKVGWPPCHRSALLRDATTGIRELAPRGHYWRVRCDLAVTRCVARSRTSRRVLRYAVKPGVISQL